MKFEKFFCFLLLLLSIYDTKRYNKRKLIIHFGRKLTTDIQQILKEFDYYNEGDKQRQILFHYYMSSFLSIQKSFFINISQYSKGFWSKFAQMTHLTKPGSMIFHLRTFLKIISKQKIRNMKTLTLMVSKYADNLKLSGMLSGSEKSYFVHSMLQILKKYQLVNKGANRFNFVMQRYQEEACEEVVQFLDSQSLFKVSKQVINHNKVNLHKILSKYVDYSYYRLPYQKMAKVYLKTNYSAQGIGQKKLDGIIGKTRDYYIKKQAKKMHSNYQSKNINRLFVRFFKKSAGDMVLSKEKTVPIQRVIGDQLAQSFSRIFNEQKFFSVQQVHKTYEKYTQFFNGLFMKMPPLKLKAINWYVKKNMLSLHNNNPNKIIKREKQMIIVKVKPHFKAKSIFNILQSRKFSNNSKQFFTRGVNRMKQILLVKSAIHHTSKAMLYNIKNFTVSQNQGLKKQVSRIKEILIKLDRIHLKAKSVLKIKKNYFKIDDQRFHKLVSRIKEIPIKKVRVHLIAKSINKTVDKKFLTIHQLVKLKKSINRQKELVLKDLFNKTIKSSYRMNFKNNKTFKNNQISTYIKSIKRQKEYNIRKTKINLISKYISSLKKQIKVQENIKNSKNVSRIKELVFQIPKNHLKASFINILLKKDKSSVQELRKYLKSINRQKENIIKQVGPIHYKATNFSDFKTGIHLYFNLKNIQSQTLNREKNNDIRAVKAHLISKFEEKIKEQIKVASKYKHTKNVSRIKEILINVEKKILKSSALHKMLKQTKFSSHELRRTIKHLERFKEKLIEKIGFKHHKAMYDNRIYKNQQLYYRLQNHLQLARNKEIDYLSGLMKKIHKANAKSGEKIAFNSKETQKIRKDLNAFKEFIIYKQKNPLKAKYFDDILNKKVLSSTDMSQTIKSLTRLKQKLIEKIGFKHHKARYDSHHKKVKIFAKKFFNHLNMKRVKEMNYLDGLLKKVLKANAKIDLRGGVLNGYQTQKLKKDLTAFKEFTMIKIKKHFKAKFIDELLTKDKFSKKDIKHTIKALTRFKEKLIQKIGFKHHKAMYESQNKKVNNFRTRFNNHLNLQRLKEMNYLDGLLKKIIKANAKIDIKSGKLNMMQSKQLQKDISSIKEFTINKIQNHLKAKFIEDILSRQQLSKKDIVQTIKNLTRFKEKLIQKVGFKHHKAMYEFDYKKNKSFKKMFNNHLNLQRLKEMNYLNGLLKKVIKANAKYDLKSGFLIAKQSHLLKKVLSAVKQFNIHKLQNPLQAKFIDSMIQKKLLYQSDVNEAVKQLTRFKEKLIQKIGKLHHKAKYEFDYKKNKSFKTMFNNHLNLQRLKEMNYLDGLLKKVIKANAKIDIKGGKLNMMQSKKLKKDLSAIKEFTINKTSTHIKAKFIDNIISKQELSQQDVIQVVKNLTRFKEKLIQKIGKQHNKVRYNENLIKDQSLKNILNNHLNLERSKQLDFLSGLAKKIIKANAQIKEQKEFSLQQDKELRKDISAFKEFYIQKKQSYLKAQFVQNILDQKKIGSNHLQSLLKHISRIKEHLINKVTPKNYAVTMDNRIIKKTSLEYKLLNHVDLVRQKEANNLNKLIKKLIKANAKLKENQPLSRLQNIQLRKDISAFKEYYIAKEKNQQSADFIMNFLNKTQISQQDLLEVNQNLNRQKEFLIQDMKQQKQIISLEEKSVDTLALKAALHAQLEMNRFKEVNIAKNRMGKLDKVTYKLDNKIELSLAQDRDIKKALSAYRDFYLSKAKVNQDVSFKQMFNLNFEFFKKKDFSYLNRMKDFHIANPKFTKHIMTMYASNFKNFYYNNYKDFKGVFDRFIDIWKNHKVIEKSEAFYLKKNIPDRQFFYENFYHIGKLLKHYKHKLILDVNSKKLLFNNKIFGVGEKQMNKVITSINKLKLKMHNTNDLDSLIALNAVRTAMENFNVNEKLKTLKKFKYVFVEKLPDHHELKFKGSLTLPSSKSERFVSNLFNSKVQYKQALHSSNMMNFNIDTMPLTNSNIQTAKNIFKAALFYPQLNPFKDYLRHDKRQGNYGNLGIKQTNSVGKNILKKFLNKKSLNRSETNLQYLKNVQKDTVTKSDIQKVGKIILKKLKEKQTLSLSKTELKFLNIIKVHQITKKELRKIFSGNMINKKTSLKSQRYQKWTLLAFKTLLDIARYRKIEKINKPTQINKTKYKRTETDNEDRLKHDLKTVKQTRNQNREIYRQILKKVYNKKTKRLPFQQKHIFKKFIRRFNKKLDRISNANLKKILLNFAAKSFQNKLRFYNLLTSPFTSKNIKFDFNQVLKKYYSKHKSKANQQSFLKQIKKQYGLKALKKIQNLSKNISKQELKKTVNFLNELILGSIKKQNQFKSDLHQSLNQFKKVIFSEPPVPAKRQSFTDSEFQFYDNILKQKEIQKIKQQNDFGKRIIAKQNPQFTHKKQPVVVVCCMCGCFTKKTNCCDDDYDNENLYFLQEADNMININPKIYVNLFLQEKDGNIKKEQSIEIQPLKEQIDNNDKQKNNQVDNNKTSTNEDSTEQQTQNQDQQKQINNIEDDIINQKQDSIEQEDLKDNKTTQKNNKQNLRDQKPQKVYSIANKIIKQEENQKNGLEKQFKKEKNNIKPIVKKSTQPQKQVLEINEQELDKKYKQKMNRYHQLHIDDLDNIYKIEHMKDYYKKYSENFIKNNKKITPHEQDYNLNFEDNLHSDNDSELVKEFQQKSNDVNKQIFNVNNSSIENIKNQTNNFSDIYDLNSLGKMSSIFNQQPEHAHFVQNNEYKLDNLEDSMNDYYQILDSKKKLIQLYKFIIKKNNLNQSMDFKGLSLNLLPKQNDSKIIVFPTIKKQKHFYKKMAQKLDDDSKNQLLDSIDESYYEDDPTKAFFNLKSDLKTLDEQIDSLKLLVKKQQKLAFESDEKKVEKLINKTITICEKSIEDIQVSLRNLTLIFDVKYNNKLQGLIQNIQKYIATKLADKILYLGSIEQKLAQLKEDMFSDYYQNSNFSFINDDEVKDHQKMLFDNKGNQMIMHEIKEYEITDDLQKMYNGITKLSRFLKDIQALTEHQGVLLDRIDLNINNAIQKTQKTNIELEICQQELKKGFIGKCIRILICLNIFVFVLLLIKMFLKQLINLSFLYLQIFLFQISNQKINQSQ